MVDLLRPRTSLYHIVAAIGIQQRVIDEHFACAEMQERAVAFYARAVTSLRSSIASSEGQADSHVLPCLLMVVLEALRGSADGLLIHLRCGLRILCESNRNTSEETREAAKLLQHYAVQTILFNTLSSEAQTTRSMLAKLLVTDADTLELEAASSPLPTLSTTTMELIGLVLDRYSVKPSPGSSDTLPKTLQTQVSRLEKRRRIIEQTIDDMRATAQSLGGAQTAVFSLAKASCVLMRIFLNASLTNQQITFDSELDSFRQVVGHVATALDLLQPSFNDGKACAASPTTLIVGLSIQTTLAIVMHRCRHPDVRRRIMSLLDRCPRREGICDLALVKASCRAISDFEENAAGGKNVHIPEDCRVHSYIILSGAETQGATPVVRLYYRPLDDGEFSSKDITLHS